MRVLIALVAGYVLGLKTEKSELEQLRKSLLALYGTEEFADVVASARAQAGSVFRMLAESVEGDSASGEDGRSPRTGRIDPGGAAIVTKVRNLVGPD